VNSGAIRPTEAEVRAQLCSRDKRAEARRSIAFGLSVYGIRAARVRAHPPGNCCGATAGTSLGERSSGRLLLGCGSPPGV